MTKEIVLIAGGNGMVGSYLNNLLTDRGYEVRILTRNKATQQDRKFFYWNPEKQEIDVEALYGVDYLIQLSGANLADKRWTASRKEELIKSRVEATHFLFTAIQKHKITLKAYVGASAIGYYGAESFDKWYNESDAEGKDFLAQLCVKWEKEHLMFESFGIRTIIMRFGVVLSNEGGALIPLKTSVKFGAGAVLGNGKQMIPWIHVFDLCNMLLFLMSQQGVNGIYNAVAPNPVTNKETMYALAQKLNRKILLPPVPAFVLKLLLGEMAVMVLTGNRIGASKIINQGFQFNYPTLESALSDLFANK